MTRARRPAAEPADGAPWLEPGDVRPGLLLFADGADPATEAACAAGAVHGIVAPAAALGALAPLARRHGLALLGQDVAGADGVHLSAPAGVAPARARLGAGPVIGAACGLSRDAAMVAGEAGADYVMFGDLDRADAELLELVAWWNPLFVIPCAAAGPFDPAAARALLDAGADLLAVRQPAAGVIEALRRAP